jgi:uncharacterized protein YvpB
MKIPIRLLPDGIEVFGCRECPHIEWEDTDNPLRPGYAGDSWEARCGHPDNKGEEIVEEELILYNCPLEKGIHIDKTMDGLGSREYRRWVRKTHPVKLFSAHIFASDRRWEEAVMECIWNKVEKKT